MSQAPETSTPPPEIQRASFWHHLIPLASAQHYFFRSDQEPNVHDNFLAATISLLELALAFGSVYAGLETNSVLAGASVYALGRVAIAAIASIR